MVLQTRCLLPAPYLPPPRAEWSPDGATTASPGVCAWGGLSQGAPSAPPHPPDPSNTLGSGESPPGLAPGSCPNWELGGLLLGAAGGWRGVGCTGASPPVGFSLGPPSPSLCCPPCPRASVSPPAQETLMGAAVTWGSFRRGTQRLPAPGATQNPPFALCRCSLRARTPPSRGHPRRRLRRSLGSKY